MCNMCSYQLSIYYCNSGLTCESEHADLIITLFFRNILAVLTFYFVFIKSLIKTTSRVT